MRRTLTNICIILCALSLYSCSCDNRHDITGNDRDCHGCIGSAGYSWSSLLQKCIRPFEEGMPVVRKSGNKYEILLHGKVAFKN